MTKSEINNEAGCCKKAGKDPADNCSGCSNSLCGRSITENPNPSGGKCSGSCKKCVFVKKEFNSN